MRRLLALAPVLLLLLSAAPAHAGQVLFGDTGSGLALAFQDAAGADDALSVLASDDRTVVGIAGPGVEAGTGCEQTTPELVSCANPGGGAITVALDLGAGNDAATLDTSTAQFAAIVEGGPGDDRLSGHGRLDGGDGNDRLEVSNLVIGATLEGQAGDDELIGSSEPATLGGGLGSDSIRGGSGNDVIVDVGDPDSRDTVACGGGDDLVELDADDVTTGCRASATDQLARVKIKYVGYRGGWTHIKRLEMRLPSFGQSAIATALLGELGAICQGKGCFRAKFKTRALGLDPPRARFVLARGAKRIPKTKLKGFKAGAKVIVLFKITISGIDFVKGVRYTMRYEKKPKADVGCAVRRPGEDDFTDVPCG